MDILKKLIISLVPALMLTGCFSEFEPDIPSTPVLCMNSLITPGDTILLELTRTWRWSEGDPDGNIDINIYNADISLYVNDRFVEKLTPSRRPRPVEYMLGLYDTIQCYKAGYIPVSGDRIRFEASSTDYGDATAEVTVPYPVNIEKVDVSASRFVNWETNYYSMDLNMLVWFTDPAEDTNYYTFATNTTGYARLDEDNSVDYVSFYGFDQSKEPLFTEHVSVLESIFSDTSGYSIFSDRQISGRSYPLHITIAGLSYEINNPNNRPEFGHGGVKLILANLSESYYKHVLSVWAANDGLVGTLGNTGLGEPVFQTSNVSTGAGAVAAAAPFTWTVEIMDIVREQSGKQD